VDYCQRHGACPGSPDPNSFVSHGLNLRPGKDSHSTLGKDIARGPVNERFSNITMALPVGNELWIGTFAGDRVAYRSF